MIRFFTTFYKFNFNQISAMTMFLEAMKDFSKENPPFLKKRCPYCGAKKPIWSSHDTYPRYLISFENGNPITYNIEITRIICSSCKHTHAIIPEIIVPHSSYSLTFIVMALKDYFSKMRVSEVCEKYQISVSLLYAWKHLFLRHKRLWLGILENVYHNSLNFLSSIPNSNTSKNLNAFFLNTGDSFLQGITKNAHFSSA